MGSNKAQKIGMAGKRRKVFIPRSHIAISRAALNGGGQMLQGRAGVALQRVNRRHRVQNGILIHAGLLRLRQAFESRVQLAGIQVRDPQVIVLPRPSRLRLGRAQLLLTHPQVSSRPAADLQRRSGN